MLSESFVLWQKIADAEEQVQEEDEESVAVEYRDIISIHAGNRKGGLKNCLNGDPNRVIRLSMSEQWLETLAKTRGPDLVKFTQRNLLRIFPKTTRFDSSNYDPLVGWIHGAQMVAFNMQVIVLTLSSLLKAEIFNSKHQSIFVLCKCRVMGDICG